SRESRDTVEFRLPLKYATIGNARSSGSRQENDCSRFEVKGHCSSSSLLQFAPDSVAFKNRPLPLIGRPSLDLEVGGDCLDVTKQLGIQGRDILKIAMVS